MSGLRAFAARALAGCLPSLSQRRRDWIRAAAAELSEIPDQELFEWAIGVGAMAIGDLCEQAFLPWRREQGARPPAAFAFVAGMALLAAPAWFVSAAIIWPDRTSGTFGIVASLAGLALSLWVNLAALLATQALGGLHYAVGIRRLPRNALAVLAACALAYLAAHVGLA
jgi:hypothetical protein